MYNKILKVFFVFCFVLFVYSSSAYAVSDLALFASIEDPAITELSLENSQTALLTPDSEPVEEGSGHSNLLLLFPLFVFFCSSGGGVTKMNKPHSGLFLCFRKWTIMLECRYLLLKILIMKKDYLSLSLKNKLNIANSDSWGDAEYLTFFKQRLSDMRAKKAEIDKEFELCEKQETALSYYNNFWELQVNVPLEQNLIEIYMGRTNWRITYEIVPDGQANMEELQASKYALNFFLDGNEKDNFWIENKDFRHNKALYWTGIFYTWMRSYKEIQYDLKDSVKLIDWSDLQDKKNFIKTEKERWFFFPKSIHPRDFYIDDNAYSKPWIQYADDCIWKEKISLIEFKMRYWGKESFNKEEVAKVVTWTDISPRNMNDNSISWNEIIIYHYFDRITKTWLVVANEKKLIYNGIYLYDDWKLPFEMVQHYTNPNCIWGRGIANRIRYLKAYKNEILQDILVGAEMWSWVHLITGNDTQLGQDWELGGRWINIWRTVWGASSVQPINTQPNLSYFTSVMGLLDDLLVQDTGDNLRSPIDAQSDRLWIVEIMESNKAVRQASIDENYNIWLDSVLTMTLSRIKQFAPSLLSEKIYNKKWDRVIKLIFPKIRIPNYDVKKLNWKLSYIKNLWKYWYFELKDDIVQWVGVKVTTSSTSSNLPILERQKVSEYFSNISQLLQIWAQDEEFKEKIKENIDIEWIITWMNDAYWYDYKLSPQTLKNKKEDKKREEEIKNKAEVETIKWEEINPLEEEIQEWILDEQAEEKIWV